MKIIFKYLKPFAGLVALAVGLLGVQAFAELKQPDYMSDIVNVGLQAGGIAENVPLHLTDEGMDFLCSISAGIIDKYAYILDIYYTDDAMEITEKEVARRLDLYGIRESVIESNNGGRGFARNVTDKLKAMGNKKCAVKWFHQSKNKKARILVNSASAWSRSLCPRTGKRNTISSRLI